MDLGLVYNDIRGTYKDADSLFDSLIQINSKTGKEIALANIDEDEETIEELASLGYETKKRSLSSVSTPAVSEDFKAANVEWYQRMKAFANGEV